MKNIVITGGCGFVGANLSLKIKNECKNTNIICFDNLRRRGSELNLAKLKKNGIMFIHGDVRVKADLGEIEKCDVLIDCSAESAVTAGYSNSPRYVLDTNLNGTLNCLELCRERGSQLILLSTSRVYPIKLLQELNYIEAATRFELSNVQDIQGASWNGISEEFPLLGARSLYGATKLASELFVEEYSSIYGLKAITNRCGLIAGPGQFGKSDQGVVALWVARHFWCRNLSYIGYDGTGKQVRDVLNINDLAKLIIMQINNFEAYSGLTFNIGGGLSNSISLVEMTKLCEKITGNFINIKRQIETRDADVKFYVSNNELINSIEGWTPVITVEETVEEIHKWISINKDLLEGILG